LLKKEEKEGSLACSDLVMAHLLMVSLSGEYNGEARSKADNIIQMI